MCYTLLVGQRSFRSHNSHGGDGGMALQNDRFADTGGRRGLSRVVR